MRTLNFVESLREQWFYGGMVCVGLDTDPAKIPQRLHREYPDPVVRFNYTIIEATKHVACAYKPNYCFYEERPGGLEDLEYTIKAIRAQAPKVPIILDFKRADIGTTNIGSVKAAFEHFQVDAVTVNPYFGKEALKPFLDRGDKGIIVLCKTSNPGGGEFQDLEIAGTEWQGRPYKLYQYVAKQVAQHWNERGNCGLVVGATYPEELAQVRRLVGDMPLLIPGIGAQGGEVEAVVRAGQDSQGQGMIINSSRGILYAFAVEDLEDFGAAAAAEANRLNSLIRGTLAACAA